jgi:hypothetical protein
MSSGGTEVCFNGGRPQGLQESEVRSIANRCVPVSTRHMSAAERLDGTRQMIRDLEALAHNDGCIAAAWALEFMSTVSAQPK